MRYNTLSYVPTNPLPLPPTGSMTFQNSQPSSGAGVFKSMSLWKISYSNHCMWMTTTFFLYFLPSSSLQKLCQSNGLKTLLMKFLLYLLPLILTSSSAEFLHTPRDMHAFSWLEVFSMSLCMFLEYSPVFHSTHSRRWLHSSMSWVAIEPLIMSRCLYPLLCELLRAKFFLIMVCSPLQPFPWFTV